MLFTQLYYSIRNYSPKNIYIPLGRWKKKNQEITLYLANIDNCGDNICGSIKDHKYYLNKYIPFIKKK